MNSIDWSKQHCGVHQASVDQLLEHMPDLKGLIDSFPENPNDFVWDVKVHMLMPHQYPCIPNWHFDNIPRVGGKQDFSLVQLDKPMYLWVSNAPLTEFREGERVWNADAQTWVRFTQKDEHRGTASGEFTWRGFIRATHKDIMPFKNTHNPLRRHSQVYLDATNFNW
jgi:hypothetical protein